MASSMVDDVGIARLIQQTPNWCTAIVLGAACSVTAACLGLYASLFREPEALGIPHSAPLHFSPAHLAPLLRAHTHLADQKMKVANALVLLLAATLCLGAARADTQGE